MGTTQALFQAETVVVRGRCEESVWACHGFRTKRASTWALGAGAHWDTRLQLVASGELGPSWLATKGKQAWRNGHGAAPGRRLATCSLPPQYPASRSTKLKGIGDGAPCQVQVHYLAGHFNWSVSRRTGNSSSGVLHVSHLKTLCPKYPLEEARLILLTLDFSSETSRALSASEGSTQRGVIAATIFKFSWLFPQAHQ